MLLTPAGTVVVMPQPTWEDRELPILTALVEMFDAGHRYIETPEIAAKTGLDENTVKIGVAALARAETPYVDIEYGETFGNSLDSVFIVVNWVTGAARQVVGTWPTPEGRADEIIAALRAVAEKTPDVEERSKLRSIAAYLASAGRDFLVDVTAATVNKQLGNS